MNDQLVKQNATLADTIELIRKRINTDYRSPFIKILVSRLYSPDPEIFARNLFNYVCRNVKYQLDPRGKEYVYRPSTTVLNGIGDCKKMTVLIGSALKAYGISPLLKHVFYKDEEYTHIYPIVKTRGGGFLILDPVNDGRYNVEVRHDFANVYDLTGKKMDLFTGARPTLKSFSDSVNTATGDIFADMSTASGCTQRTTGQISDAITEALSQDPEIMGKRAKKTPAQRKENRKKALEKFKKVAVKGLAAGMRAAFLLILALNVRNIAKKLNVAWAKDPKRVETFWSKFGGDPLKLKQTMLEGSKKKETMGSAIAVSAATALPVITALLKLLKDMKVVNPEDAAKIEELEEDAEGDVADNKVDPEKTAKDAGGDGAPPPPTVGSYWQNTLDTPSDWIGAGLKLSFFSVALNSLPLVYILPASICGIVLFIGYVVKLKIRK